ncbi:MAG: heavy metal translocating P-type ATPase, partial [Xanthomonadales bacterium]|nr:heavy metal translocating P-type ATPase [Xanthomonadales bacterium]
MTEAAAASRPGARNGHGAPALAKDACFHCGEALPAEPVLAVVGGARHPFCCSGCAAASAWIQDAGLSDYYTLRTANGARVDLDPAALEVWDAPSVQAEHVREVEGGCEITLIADGMHCAACAWLIDNALAREPGVREATANAMTGRLRLVWDPAATRLSQPLQRLRALGYTPCLATGAAREQAKRRERNRDLIRIGIAGLGTMQAMMFAEALYLDTGNTMSAPMRDFLRWITFLVSTPVVFYAGWTFLSGAWRELRLRRPGMDTLVATSTLLAYFASVWETINGGPHVWYDAAVMFVFLLLAARLLEQRARRVANAQVDALARARPVFATREAADGSHEAIPLAALEAGDIARIAAGDTVPADGELLDAPALLEEALLTGESRPVERQPGEIVLAGSIAHQRPLRMRVTATGTGTRLSHLIRLVEDAQAHRPPLARMADRIAAWFVVGMLLAAVAVYVAWRLHDPSRAFEVALALLVISCPCALSLAVPAALAAA